MCIRDSPQSNLIPADFLGQLVSLIRVAKHDTKQLYAGYSESNIERVKYMSKMCIRDRLRTLRDLPQ